jgi:hypothetical protein
MGKIQYAYPILTAIPEKKGPVGSLMCRWEDNVKMGLKETECEDAEWIHLVGGGVHFVWKQ